MTERRYVHTFAELVDRWVIVVLKEIFIPENRKEYREEGDAIKHDINVILEQMHEDLSYRLTAVDIHAIVVLALVNREIWLNEAIARAGGQSDRLRLTHSINGVRAKAKNILAMRMGDRVDLKADTLAADLPPEFGSWGVL